MSHNKESARLRPRSLPSEGKDQMHSRCSAYRRSRPRLLVPRPPARAVATDVERILDEVAVAQDQSELLDCAERFNEIVATFTPHARECAVERFTDIAAERGYCKQ